MRECPACGFKTEAISNIGNTEGELVQITKRKMGDAAPSKVEKSAFYAQLKGCAQTRGYSDGWTAHKFREKFGVWPNGYKDVPAMEPTPEVLSWIKSRQIAWAKSKQSHAQPATA